MLECKINLRALFLFLQERYNKKGKNEKGGEDEENNLSGFNSLPILLLRTKARKSREPIDGMDRDPDRGVRGLVRPEVAAVCRPVDAALAAVKQLAETVEE